PLQYPWRSLPAASSLPSPDLQQLPPLYSQVPGKSPSRTEEDRYTIPQQTVRRTCLRQSQGSRQDSGSAYCVPSGFLSIFLQRHSRSFCRGDSFFPSSFVILPISSIFCLILLYSPAPVKSPYFSADFSASDIFVTVQLPT